MNEINFNLSDFPQPRFNLIRNEDCMMLNNYLLDKVKILKGNKDKNKYFENFRMLIYALYSCGININKLRDLVKEYFQELIHSFNQSEIEKNEVILAESFLLLFGVDAESMINLSEKEFRFVERIDFSDGKSDILDWEYNFISNSGICILSNKKDSHYLREFEEEFLKKVDYKSILIPIFKGNTIEFVRSLDENIEGAIERARICNNRSPKNNFLQKSIGYYDFGQILQIIGYYKLFKSNGYSIEITDSKHLEKFQFI